MTDTPIKDYLNIAVRAYATKAAEKRDSDKSSKLSNRRAHADKAMPSPWLLVFDTETFSDPSQRLRFGTYRVWEGERLHEAGIFYDAANLQSLEIDMLKAYAEAHDLDFIMHEKFVEEVFYYYGYDLRGTIVGFNLPFDVSRLILSYCTARTAKWDKSMQDAFSFKLSDNSRRPRLQVKHVSSRNAFFRFVAPPKQQTNKSARAKGKKEGVPRGYFIDVRTLAAALTSKSFKLGKLADYLETLDRKLEVESYDASLTPEFIDYAMRDTLVTYQCLRALLSVYKVHDLNSTPPHKIHSEASLGKAYFKQMGLMPWRKMQPDFPPHIIGIMMSSYYGGRSEVAARRETVQVTYCDFVSMYPTVCTLMGLWKFMTAKGINWRDSTEETKTMLKNIDLGEFQKPDIWNRMHTLVKVIPNGDIFPIRADYDNSGQYTIGLNHVESKQGTWYTLADCFVDKLLYGRAPEIIESITFEPMEPQEGLKPINLMGDPTYRINPKKDDFFQRVIDMRASIKAEMESSSGIRKEKLDTQQNALKILANSTSYGIFVEVNVESNDDAQEIQCFGPADPFKVAMKRFESPGSYFHPLLATLITGAARLMLALAERQVIDAGLDWAFCDTDSMAIAKPANMPMDEFYNKSEKVQQWFTQLCPYEVKTPLFKMEKENYLPSNKTTKEPLFCYAVSSKRYALFNILSDGAVLLRKVSAHGLGHLLPPYTRDRTPADLKDVEPWQQDFWMKIIEADLRGSPDMPEFRKLRNFDKPAVSRYSATTPDLLAWFKDDAYQGKISPFNFLLVGHAKKPKKVNVGTKRSKVHHAKPLASYQSEAGKVNGQIFDRNTGKLAPVKLLKTYLDVLAQYHLHPEAKFLNGDYTNKGRTQRRYIQVRGFELIGKEADKWEEQYYLGYDSEKQIRYGSGPREQKEFIKYVKEMMKELKWSYRKLGAESEISYQQLSKILQGNVQIRGKTKAKIMAAIYRVKLSAG